MRVGASHKNPTRRWRYKNKTIVLFLMDSIISGQLAHLRAEKCFFRRTCRRKKQISFFSHLRVRTLRGFFDKLKRDLRRSLAWFSLLVPSGYKLTTLSAAEKHLHKRAVKKARLLYRDQSFKAIAALFRFPKNQDSSSLSSASSEPEALLKSSSSCSTVKCLFSSPETSTATWPSYIMIRRLP